MSSDANMNHEYAVLICLLLATGTVLLAALAWLENRGGASLSRRVMWLTYAFLGGVLTFSSLASLGKALFWGLARAFPYFRGNDTIPWTLRLITLLVTMALPIYATFLLTQVARNVGCLIFGFPTKAIAWLPPKNWRVEFR